MKKTIFLTVVMLLSIANSYSMKFEDIVSNTGNAIDQTAELFKKGINAGGSTGPIFMTGDALTTLFQALYNLQVVGTRELKAEIAKIKEAIDQLAKKAPEAIG